VPLGSFPGPAASMAVSIAGTALLIAANVVVLRRASAPVADERPAPRWGFLPRPA